MAAVHWRCILIRAGDASKEVEQAHAAALLGALLGCSEGWKLLQTVAVDPLDVVAAFVRLHDREPKADDQVPADFRRHICLYQLQNSVRNNSALADRLLLLASAVNPAALADPIEAALPVFLIAAMTPAGGNAQPTEAAMVRMRGATMIFFELFRASKPSSRKAFVESSSNLPVEQSASNGAEEASGTAGLAAAIGESSRWILNLVSEAQNAEMAETDVEALSELLSLFAALWAAIGRCAHICLRGPAVPTRRLRDAHCGTFAIGFWFIWGALWASVGSECSAGGAFH